MVVCLFFNFSSWELQSVFPQSQQQDPESAGTQICAAGAVPLGRGQVGGTDAHFPRCCLAKIYCASGGTRNASESFHLIPFHQHGPLEGVCVPCLDLWN